MNNRHGYTIIEIVAIIAVIGILIAIALPRFGAVSKNIARTTSRQIMSDIRYVRRLAIASAKDHIIRFYPAGGPYNEYRLFRKERMLEEQLGEPKQIPEQIICTGTEELTFNPFGYASGSGIISLIADGDQYDVNVVAATGRVY
jgi:hypothetical protein